MISGEKARSWTPPSTRRRRAAGFLESYVVSTPWAAERTATRKASWYVEGSESHASRLTWKVVEGPGSHQPG